MVSDLSPLTTSPIYTIFCARVSIIIPNVHQNPKLNQPRPPLAGGKILLNNARLVLKRGRRYGLCGANGSGKSTLMKAIAAGKVEGFPPPDKLLTVYVEHDIQASLEELTVGAAL